MRLRPFTIPVKASCICNTRRCLDIEATQYLLDGSFHPRFDQQIDIANNKHATYFFPLVVTGISGHSSIMDGTCLALRLCLIVLLIELIKFVSS